MSPLNLLKISHLNALVDGLEHTIAHLESTFDAQLNFRIPGDPDDADETDACLITVGGVIFELFAPRRRGERGQGKLLERFGDHYLGIEFQVLDVGMARLKCGELGVRIINDPGPFFFTHPGACLGISWELWDGNWYEALGPDSERGPLHPRSYWRDEHALGLDGLARISVAVSDLDVAAERFRAIAGAQPQGRADHPQAVARGAEFTVGDTLFELLAPTGEGPVSRFLDRYGERVRSAVFAATDLARVEQHLRAKGIDTVPGYRDGTLAIPPHQNHNLLFEFSE